MLDYESVARPQPAQPGMRLEEVDTPALILDLDVFEANLSRVAKLFRACGVLLRPHAKSHKCAEIAKAQIALGAVGVCCQKVSEAEALVAQGINDVLISNEIVSRSRLQRVAALAGRARVAVCVDHSLQVERLSEAVRARGNLVDVLVEIDVGARRCGVAPGASAVALARQVAACELLEFRGLQAYHGGAQHIRQSAERRLASQAAMAAAEATVSLLAESGLHCDVVTGGGTGTFEFDLQGDVYNELQPGSYIFMDADYSRNAFDGGSHSAALRQSLFVYTQVMSRPRASVAIVDCGLKAVATDSGMPLVADYTNVAYRNPSDEHGTLDISLQPDAFGLGKKLRLVPGHCDPTVNLYDWIVAVRQNRVESVWAVNARGAVA